MDGLGVRQGGQGHKRPTLDTSGGSPNPFVVSTSGAALADVKLQQPVVYVIDAGAAMEPTYDMAVGMVRVSIRSLSATPRSTSCDAVTAARR